MHVSDGPMTNILILQNFIQEFKSLYVKFLFLITNSFQWVQGFEAVIVINHCWWIISFNVLLTTAIFVLICFRHPSGLALFFILLLLNFLFTWAYYISNRVKIF